MKEITNGLAKLVAIIVIMAALAVWTAGLSLWASADAPTQSEQLSPQPAAEKLEVANAGR